MKNFLESRPQRLCLECGQCCKTVTTTDSYETLLEKKSKGDKGAIDFLSIFEPYPSIDDARKDSKKIVDNILKYIPDEKKASITFYRCKYLQKNNLCGRYENRPQLCRNFPSTPWAVVPPGCGFEGWLFLKREERMKLVRHYKEEIIAINAEMSKVTDKKKLEQMHIIVKKMESTIDLFAKYGSKDW